jgi:N-acetylglucosaminyl-diphospho-decaprenol L-rhamnosyltransferase
MVNAKPRSGPRDHDARRPQNPVVTSTAMSSVDLSVCIVTRQQPELLPKCVASCMEEFKNAGVTGEIILVDNGSLDGYPARSAERYSGIRIIRNESNLGFSAANNQAIRSSAGSFVLILNDDAMLQEGSLGLMLAKLRSDDRIGAIGPRIVNPDGTPQSGFTNKRFPSLRALTLDLLGLDRFLFARPFTRDLLTMRKDEEISGETDQVAGACLLARRAAIDAVGLFDEGFYFWFEDTDLCYRLKRAGWKIMYLAEARVTHHGSASLNTLSRPEKAAVLFKSLAYYFKKNTSPLKYWFTRLTLALLLIARVPSLILYRLYRRDSRPQEWRESAEASLRTARLLLLEWDW